MLFPNVSFSQLLHSTFVVPKQILFYIGPTSVIFSFPLFFFSTPPTKMMNREFIVYFNLLFT